MNARISQRLFSMSSILIDVSIKGLHCQPIKNHPNYDF